MLKMLTPEARREFDENGFYFPVRVMPEEEALALRHKVEAFERKHPEAVGKLDIKPNLLLTWLDAVTRHEPLLDAVEDILGPDIFCWGIAFRNKPADGRTYVSWHQDTAYIKFKPLMLTCWFAITEATVENGCLRLIPGSHKWPRLRHGEKDDPYAMLTRGHYIAEDFDDSNAVDMVLRPGEIGLIDFATTHGSGPNLSADRRMAMLVDCFATSAVKFEGGRDTGMLVRGVDDYDNFDHEVPPQVDYGPEEVERHRRAVEQMSETFYAGSDRTPIAISGKAQRI